MVDYICASWLISPPDRANALNTQDWVLTKRTSEKLSLYIQILDLAPLAPQNWGKRIESPPNLGDLGGIDVADETFQTTSKLNNKLVAAGINLPFPIQQILFHERTEKTDGDRSNGNYN